MERENLTLENAKIISEIVQKMASDRGGPIVIAFVNQWGSPVLVHFMDGALPASYDIALNKAYTAATTRISTEELMDRSSPGGDLFGINFSNNGKIITFPGGYPLTVKGKVVGAIGVSGGAAKYDNDLAFLGKESFELLSKGEKNG